MVAGLAVRLRFGMDLGTKPARYLVLALGCFTLRLLMKESLIDSDRWLPSSACLTFGKLILSTVGS